uniref:Uncharacterized protein n=1 Tax=viral metagenome TaxID=1070528 RepID=A0A6M3M9Z9_9ZZZZ
MNDEQMMQIIRTEEKVKVMKHFMNEGIVEKKHKTNDANWSRVRQPTWNWYENNYRIAQETPVKIEFDDLVGRVVKVKNTEYEYVIGHRDNNNIYYLTNSRYTYLREDLLKECWIKGVNCE